MTVRWFFALRPPQSAIRDLWALAADLALPRATTPDTWHITLAYMGELSDVEVAAVRRAAEIVAPRRMPMRLSMAGMGTFGGGHPTVVFARMDGEVTALRNLSEALRAGLDEVGVGYDAREYHPHLTLARPGRSGPLTTAQRLRLEDYHGPEWTADGLWLYRSLPGTAGRYEAVARYPLHR